MSVPLVLALATGLWVWVLPETRGIQLPQLKDHQSPLAEEEEEEEEEDGVARDGLP